jgi:hypothetical protein
MVAGTEQLSPTIPIPKELREITDPETASKYSRASGSDGLIPRRSRVSQGRPGIRRVSGGQLAPPFKGNLVPHYLMIGRCLKTIGLFINQRKELLEFRHLEQKLLWPLPALCRGEISDG